MSVAAQFTARRAEAHRPRPRLSLAQEVLLVIEAMTVDQALQTLGLTRADLGDKDKVKKTYRQKALDAHPDRGGSEEQMKLVNQAYDILTGSSAGGAGSPADQEQKYQDFKARQKETDAKMKVVLKSMADELDQTIKLDAFKAHVEKATGKTFKATIDKKETSYHYLIYTIKLVSEDGLTSFDMTVHASAADVAYGKGAATLGGSGAEHVSFPISIVTTVFHDNRKVKLAAKNWKLTSDHKTLIEPEDLFPTSKLAKMMGGKDKGRKFQKRDMLLSLEKRLGAYVWSGKDIKVTIPVGDAWLLLFRSTWRGQAAWMTNALYSSKNGGKSLSHVTFGTFEESEATIEFLVKLHNGAKGKTGDELATYLNDELKKHKGAAA